MKGILPVYCRTMGYVVLLLSVFVPMVMFMCGKVNDGNLLLVKAAIKMSVWFALFMIFLARVKQENEETARIRVKSMGYALYLLGVYYLIALMRAVHVGNLELADRSIPILYMALNVLCVEFGLQRHRARRLFKK